MALTVTAANACGTTTPATTNIPITPKPTASLSGSSSMIRGSSATLDVTLTGAAPWRLDWSDGYVQTNITSTTVTRTVTPNASETYTVTVSSNGCQGTSGPWAVRVLPPAPQIVSATTQENRNVLISWTTVAGASGYRIERAARRDSAATFVTTVPGTSTSFSDLVPASASPVTYIYYVRTIDAAGELSNRGAWDHATTATMLYAQPSLSGAIIKAADVTELRLAIDALRYALDLPSAFGSTAAPAGAVPAADFTALVTALNGAHAAIGIAPFTYSGVAAPAPGVAIYKAHIEQLREALR